MVRVRRTRPQRRLGHGRPTRVVVAVVVSLATLSAEANGAVAQDPLDEVIGCDMEVATRYLDQEGVLHRTVGTGRVASIQTQVSLGVAGSDQPPDTSEPDETTLPGGTTVPDGPIGADGSTDETSVDAFGNAGRSVEASAAAAGTTGRWGAQAGSETTWLIGESAGGGPPNEACGLVEVPDLVGLDLVQARVDADGAGLITEWDHLDPTGVVQAQDPVAFRIVPRNTMVVVEVREPGVEEVPPPDESEDAAGPIVAATRSEPEGETSPRLWLLAAVLVVALMLLVTRALRARRRVAQRPEVQLRPEPTGVELRGAHDLLSVSARADAPTRTLVEVRP